MSRPIKFRAWHTKRHEMLLPAPGVSPFWHEQELFSSAAIGEPIILNQFTGCYDKNGREIYEDDIVAAYNFDGKPYFTATIKFEKGEFRTIVEGWEVRHSIGSWCVPLEVIGNVYEDNS